MIGSTGMTWTTFAGRTCTMSSLTTRADTTASTSASYTVRHVGWPEPERVVLPECADPGAGLVITNRSLKRDGRRWIPTSGDIHFSPLPRRQWPLTLKLLPRFNYDFHAPIGRDQRTRESFHRLRAQHTFLVTFEQSVAGMTTTDVILTAFAGTGQLEFDLRVTSFNPEISIRLT